MVLTLDRYNRIHSLKYLKSTTMGLQRYTYYKIRVCDKDSIPLIYNVLLSHFEYLILGRCYGDVIACDFSKSPWRQKLEFDCIITDPPYGIRKALAKNINFL